MEKAKIQEFIGQLSLNEIEELVDMLDAKLCAVRDKVDAMCDVESDITDPIDWVFSHVRKFKAQAEEFKKETVLLGEEYKKLYEVRQSIIKATKELHNNAENEI